jgi:putative methyltransferase
MGFFVAAFVRAAPLDDSEDNGPYLRDGDGKIIRDMMGMPQAIESHSGEIATAHGRGAGDKAVVDKESLSDDEWDGFSE